jgi:hypothetical protein
MIQVKACITTVKSLVSNSYPKDTTAPPTAKKAIQKKFRVFPEFE